MLRFLPRYAQPRRATGRQAGLESSQSRAAACLLLSASRRLARPRSPSGLHLAGSTARTDYEQTPSNGEKAKAGPTTYKDWTVWQPYNGVGGHLEHCESISNRSSSCQVWVAPGGNDYPDWESCSKAADAAMSINPLIHMFTWWKYDPNTTKGSCWLSQHLYKGTGGPEPGHVMGN
jgi:hypothetical protein